MIDQAGAPVDPAAQTFFGGRGELARLTGAFDWDSTPLGPVEGWTASLRTTVSTLLASRHAMFLWWGPHLIQFYNDAYRQSLGPDRHPSALGARGRECWAEIWPIIGAEVESIMAGGEATWHEDSLVPITRGDHLRDVYWSYSYSPVRDDDGSVGGVLVTVQETTRRVLQERRGQLLHQLAAEMLQAGTVGAVTEGAARWLASASDDLGFALLYLGDERAGALTLACATGLDADATIPPPGIRLDGEGVWPVEQMIRGRWAEPVCEAVTALIGSGSAAHGVLVLGFSPRLPVDQAARQFAGQVAREIAVTLDGIARSTRERDQVAVAARAERDLLSGVFQLSPSFLAVLRGPEHVFELVNPAYDQLIGHRPAIGRCLRDVLPEVEEQGFLELLDRVYATGTPVIGNEALVELPPTGGGALQSRYLNFVYQAMRGPGSEIVGVLVTGTDVTALVEARQAVEESLRQAQRLGAERDIERRRLSTMLDQAPLGVALIGPSGDIQFANARFERLWGRVPGGTAGEVDHNAYSGFHLDGRPIAAGEWAGARAVQQGEIVEGEVIQIVQPGGRGDAGRRLTVWISAAPIRDAEGRITGGVVMVRDVTAERRTEQQLRDAQRLLAVGTLAGGVAHEVNNALQGVLGFGSFVLGALGPEHPQAADMRLVLQSAERAARVSQQLLAYTRQQVTRPEPIELHALVTHLRPVLRQLLGADKLLLVDAPREKLPLVQADRAQVEQVLINLVANARDATETGGDVTIRVEHAHIPAEGAAAPAPTGKVAPRTAAMGFQLAPGDYVRLSVSDSGHGMTAETLTHIFDPFFTTKPVGEGTGLGLSMVYGTVKQHGGYVGATSEPGKGTTMELYWPVKAGSTPARDDAHTGRGPATGTGGRGRVVLVADDEPLVRRLAARVLSGDGYVVIEAQDGAAALGTIERERLRPDLVITDVIMPRRNGRQLYDALAARWPDLPVLFTSGHTGEEAVLQRLVPHGAPFLQKPFSAEALLRAVGNLVGPRQDSREVSGRIPTPT
jgi:signal transduction histidine kinase/CheY-like chemotaxis protein